MAVAGGVKYGLPSTCLGPSCPCSSHYFSSGIFAHWVDLLTCIIALSQFPHLHNEANVSESFGSVTCDVWCYALIWRGMTPCRDFRDGTTGEAGGVVCSLGTFQAIHVVAAAY